jgi:hypothetical protein
MNKFGTGPQGSVNFLNKYVAFVHIKMRNDSLRC